MPLSSYVLPRRENQDAASAGPTLTHDDPLGELNATEQPGPPSTPALLDASLDRVARDSTPLPGEWSVAPAPEPTWVMTAVWREAPRAPERWLLAMVDRPWSAAADHFRILRHRLTTVESPRWLAVAAAHGGPDVARCAVELALAYAEASSELVLLVELDTTRPLLARMLGVEIEECLSEQVFRRASGDLEPWRSIAIFRENLHLLAAHPSSKAARRLTPGALKTAIAQLSCLGYAQVVLTAPPLLGTADAALISGVIDGVVLTGRLGSETARSLRQAANLVAPARVCAASLLSH